MKFKFLILILVALRLSPAAAESSKNPFVRTSTICIVGAATAGGGVGVLLLSAVADAPLWQQIKPQLQRLRVVASDIASRSFVYQEYTEFGAHSPESMEWMIGQLRVLEAERDARLRAVLEAAQIKPIAEEGLLERSGTSLRLRGSLTGGAVLLLGVGIVLIDKEIAELINSLKAQQDWTQLPPQPARTLTQIFVDAAQCLNDPN